MIINNIKLIFLKLIIIIGLVCGIVSSAQAGFVYFDPTHNLTRMPWDLDWAGCMEDSWDVHVVSSSTMFNPKIKVHNRLVIACFGWEDTLTLSAYGECNFFGAVRVCARITPAGEYGNNYCSDGSCDPARGENSSNDSACPSCSPKPMYRICVFEDPMAPADPNDPNPYSMPSHALSPPPPDQSMGDQGTEAYEAATSDVTKWMEDTGIMVPGIGLGASMVAQEISVAGDILNMALELTGLSYINYVANNAIAEAKPSMWLISSNLDSSGNRGCVDYPTGPPPPPYCSPVVGTVPTVNLSNLCQYSPEFEASNSYKQTSTSSDTCEISSSNSEPNGSPVYNSFENPMVRLYFNNPMHICDADHTSTGSSDLCFVGNTLSSPSNIWLNNKSLLPICDGTTTTNCVSFHSGRKTGPPGGTTNSFRTYYNLSNPSCIGNTTAGADQQMIDYAVYPPPTSGNACEVVLAGIYDSNYIDIAVGQTLATTDYINLTRTYTATLNTEDGDGMSLCITEGPISGTGSESNCSTADDGGGATEITCDIARPHMFQPTVSSCLDQTACYYNDSSVPYEQPRISFNVGNPSKRGIVGIDLALTDGSNPPNTLPPKPFCVLDEKATTGAGDSTSYPAPCQVYQAKVFSAYVTDSYNKTSDSSPTGDGTITPYSGGDPYTGGIQYAKGIYCRGATRICLDGYYEPYKQVVAKILYTTDTNGATTSVISKDIRDRIIPPYVQGQEALGTTPVFDENINYLYDEVTTTRTGIGYKDSSGHYYENSACTATPSTYNCTYTGTITSTTPAPVTCTCSNTTSSNYSCSNQNCEWAFFVNNTTTSTAYTGYKYTDGNNVTTNYPLYDTSGRLQYDKRPLNPLEIGICVETQVPYCNAVDDSTGDTSANGYASWVQTSVNGTTTGTCVGTMEESSSGPPKRKCIYKDDGTYQLSGCPNYTIAWDVVENPCGNTPVPAWWPGEFLANQSKYQGAIFNQFNVNYYYQTTFVPQTRNLDPFNTASTVPNAEPTAEGWVTQGYNSCKSYNSNISLTGNAKRANLDGDQEMLYLTRAQWQYLWNNNDLTWLLATSSQKAAGVDYANYDGCYVYDLKGNVNASVTGTVKVGMKICKYQDKISFSLVDFENDIYDYTNTAYIMQSNLIAYDQWNTQWANTYGIDDPTFIPNTQVTNSNGDRYNHYINHGIVVNRTGWNDNYTVPTIASPPFNSPITTAETTSADYSFVAYYYYSTTSKDFWGHSSTNHYYQDTVNPYPGINGGTKENLTNYTLRMPGKVLPVQTTDCALSAYRNAINYAEATNYLTYIPMPTLKPDDSGGPFINKMYKQTDYACCNNDDGRRETQCGMRVKLYNYRPGNSAANPNMFLWNTKDSYNVCNY